MEKYIGQLLKMILLTFTGVIGSIIVGLLVYGSAVFSPTSIGFSFVSYGLSGAFIFAFYHVRGLSETMIAAAVVSIIQFLVVSAWINALYACIWSFGVNFSLVLLAFVFERKLAQLKQLKFLVVAVLYGAVFVFLTLLVAIISGVELLPPTIFRENFVDGLLIGLGLGVGIEGGEAFIHSLEHHGTKFSGPVEKHA